MSSVDLADNGQDHVWLRRAYWEQGKRYRAHLVN